MQKRPTLRHIIMKLQNTEDKEKILETSKKKKEKSQSKDQELKMSFHASVAILEGRK